MVALVGLKTDLGTVPLDCGNSVGCPSNCVVGIWKHVVSYLNGKDRKYVKELALTWAMGELRVMSATGLTPFCKSCRLICKSSRIFRLVSVWKVGEWGNCKVNIICYFILGEDTISDFLFSTKMVSGRSNFSITG